MSGQSAETDIARTRRAQLDAADPRASVWVSANAGTGKTHVLTQRVLRLLLAGTKPERILCLTYTKAAAAEMSKRVFDTLAQWVTLPGERLAQQIGELCDRPALAGRGRAGAHAVRRRHRDARRAQGADHPFVLRAPAATLPAGGQRGARLYRARRRDRPGAAARGHRRDPARSDGRVVAGAAPGAGSGHSLCGRGSLRRRAAHRPRPAALAGQRHAHRLRRACGRAGRARSRLSPRLQGSRRRHGRGYRQRHGRRHRRRRAGAGARRAERRLGQRSEDG